MARTLSMAGCAKGDTVQNGAGYGLLAGGLGVHYGARRIGANIIPVSSGNTRRQLMLMRDFGTTHLTCTPSYSLFLAESARKKVSTFASCRCAPAVLAPSRGARTCVPRSKASSISAPMTSTA